MEEVRAGDRFVTTEAIHTHALTHWRAPVTLGFETVIPKGTVLVAPYDAVPTAPGFACVPESYDELEAALVPEADRTAPKYDGFSFVLLRTEIGRRLRRLPVT
jgi:hypothetical protein